MDVEVPRCWSGIPAPVNAALVDPQPGGQTTSASCGEQLDTSSSSRNRGVWNVLQKTYVQQWTSIGCIDDNIKLHLELPMARN
ncbi:jg8049 [Pararge aegeria aegeria]|uniref:Jg8049 protein n=1 Tax=Pararge aegeria aegeria TaxID=348720 RepID=A0A8S4QVY4_9NEOP|nr:jg8049 [Pararge aegeria aegeria]